MKALKILGAVFGLLIVAIGVIFAVGIPGGFITGAIEERVEKETGLQLDINGGATIKLDRKSTRLNSSHIQKSRMPSSA